MEPRFAFRIVGVVLSVLGLVLIFSIDSIFNYILYTKLPLYPNSTVYESWRKSPKPVNMDIYVFNWTNPEKVKVKDVKPNFVELGPYRFHEYHEKTNITWNANNTVTYRKKLLWFHDAGNTNGSLKDNVTMPNPVAVGVNYMARYWTQFMSYPLSSTLLLMEKTVWITKTVGEFLFEGYEDPLMSMAASIPGLASMKMPQDKVGYFYKKNDSIDFNGVLNVETGTHDLSKLGMVRQWNYNSSTGFNHEECDAVRGFSGELYPPGQTREKPLEMFSSQLCRSMSLDYLEDVEVRGIQGYRYALSKSVLDNGTTYPDKWCNCGGGCLPQGVMNLSACRFGVPAFASLPHFMDADSYYVNRIDGVKPDPKRHRFQITLEPKTGIILDVSARLQYNLLLHKNVKLTMFQNVPTIMLPIMWFEETATIPSEAAASIRTLLMIPVFGLYCSIGLLLLGVIVTISTFRPRFCRSKGWSPNPSIQRQPPEGTSMNEFSKATDHPENTLNDQEPEVAKDPDKISSFDSPVMTT